MPRPAIYYSTSPALQHLLHMSHLSARHGQSHQEVAKADGRGLYAADLSLQIVSKKKRSLVDIIIYIYLSIYPSIHPYIYRSIHPSFLPTYLASYLSIYLTSYLSIYLPTYHLSIYLPIYLSIYLI